MILQMAIRQAVAAGLLVLAVMHLEETLVLVVTEFQLHLLVAR